MADLVSDIREEYARPILITDFRINALTDEVDHDDWGRVCMSLVTPAGTLDFALTPEDAVVLAGNLCFEAGVAIKLCWVLKPKEEAALTTT